MAIGLAVPGALIFTAACILIPWMIETERRLKNDYWEVQLGFAIFALGMAAIGFPFLVLRVFCRGHRVAIGCWAVAIFGNFAVFSYIVQSHFPIIPKLVIGLSSAAFAVVSMKAMQEDWSQNRPS
ncbi:MAG: hypothetical protein J0M24_25095 [Verrucomicrobia bacterium]|nr:hypothetical protein [Verrucomicrobiota bacterium]